MKKIFSLSLLLFVFVSFESCISIKSTSKKNKAAAALSGKKEDQHPNCGYIFHECPCLKKMNSQYTYYL